eukprot:Seg765.5 transcript_id=Seg765.5/GoldUCD/mRNA.D3Y31 product="High affinity cationic amino acid transporter 1" protein_id=Seg765.5/GoldUCD/D3Y31
MDSMKTISNVWFRGLFRRKKITRSTKQIHGLARCLTTTHLISLGVGATLGAGTYVVTGQVAANMAGPSVTISFAIAAFTSILSGLCYAEFGSRVPKTTGSAYTYSYVTVGEIWAFVIGWNLILEYMIGTAADAAALSGAFDYAIGYRVRNLTITYIGTFNTSYIGEYPDFLSFIFTIMVTIILACGVRESAQFTTFFNIFNVTVVIFIIVTGFIYADIRNWTEGDGFFPYGGMGVISGAATCFYAFVGFDVIATTGEEATNAPKSIPIAIVASLLIVFVAYFGVSSVVTLMIPYNLLDKHSPIPDAFKQRGLPWANYIISIGAICGLSSSLLGNLFPLPRIILAMSHDGLLFECLGRINKRTEVPVNATVYPGILTAFFALLFDLQELVEMMSIGTLLAYSLVSLCVLILRYQPDDHIQKSHEYEAETGKQERTTEMDNAKIEVAEDILRPPLLSPDKEQEVINGKIQAFDTFSIDDKTEESESSLLLGDSKTSEDQSNTEADSRDQSHDKSRAPTRLTGRIVSCSCILLLLWFFGFNSTLIFAFDDILNKQILPITLLVVFGVLSIGSICVIASMPQSKTKIGFMAPCIPGMPILAIYLNIFLMLRLSTITWVRFGVWMLIGAMIYLFYGTWFSKQGIDDKKELTEPLDKVD